MIVHSRTHAYYAPVIYQGDSLNHAFARFRVSKIPENVCQAPATANSIRFNNIHLPINSIGFPRIEVVVLANVDQTTTPLRTGSTPLSPFVL